MLLIVLVVALSVVLTLVGSPSPVLFGALCAGLVYALSMAEPPTVPALAFTTGQAILGASIGAFFDPNILTWLRDDWAPVIGVSVGTLALSVLVGFVLRLHPGVSAVTGTFAMVAGGASGIVALARELGADDRIVPVVQYLRVLVIIIGMPLVAHVSRGPESLARSSFRSRFRPGYCTSGLH